MMTESYELNNADNDNLDDQYNFAAMVIAQGCLLGELLAKVIRLSAEVQNADDIMRVADEVTSEMQERIVEMVEPDNKTEEGVSIITEHVAEICAAATYSLTMSEETISARKDRH